MSRIVTSKKQITHSLPGSVMPSTHLPIFSTHLLTSRRNLSRPTAVGRPTCVLKYRPTVGLIPPVNADSNVESAVNASQQSALDNDVSAV